uniref:Mucin-5AC-like isoform X3 n=1 Tax=Crassostrea virginica TaxID=6565 RepID=A0A8B8CNX1_CRAVI|nr:mucin-5AC-like isoform X3 [Crassostrea virginica]
MAALTLSLLWLVLRTGESVFHSANNLTWTEAQAFCRSNQSTLIPGTKAGFPYPHWTGLYHRLSDWIHVLGCYDNQTVEDLRSSVTFSLDRGSVGLCQERCGSRGVFALRNSSCLCLGSTPQSGSLSSSRCQWSCSTDDEGHTNDCGGSDTYNVYLVTPMKDLPAERTYTENCMVLGCYESWSQIHASNCSDDLGRICTNHASSSFVGMEDFNSWNETYSDCKKEGGYIFGNFSVHDAPRTLCQRLSDVRSNTTENWLGAARQVFLTRDRGYADAVVIDCQACWEESSCSFVKNCNDADQRAVAVCGDDSDLLPTTTTSTTELPTTTTTEKPTTTTTEMPTTTTEMVTTTTTEMSTTTTTTEIPTTTTTEMPTTTTEIVTTATTEMSTTTTTEMPTTTTEMVTTTTTEMPTTTTTEMHTTTTEIPTTTTQMPTTTTEMATTTTPEMPETTTTEMPTTITTEMPTTTAEMSTTTTTEISTSTTAEMPTTTAELPTTTTTEMLTTTTEIVTTSTTEMPTTNTTEIPTTTTTEMPTTTTEMATTITPEMPETTTTEMPPTITTTPEISTTTIGDMSTTSTATEIQTTTEVPATTTTATEIFTTEMPTTTITGMPFTTTTSTTTTTQPPATTTAIPVPTKSTTTSPLSNGTDSPEVQSGLDPKTERAVAVTASVTVVGLVLIVLGLIWKGRRKIHYRRKQDPFGITYRHFDSGISNSLYDSIVLPGEVEKEHSANAVEMEILPHHAYENAGYHETSNGAPPPSSQSVPQQTVTKPPNGPKAEAPPYRTAEAPPYRTVISVTKDPSPQQHPRKSASATNLGFQKEGNAKTVINVTKPETD